MPDTFAVVILMIVITYVLAVALTQPWGVSIVVVAQIATVTATLRTSHARRGLRRLATAALVVAAVVAMFNLIQPTDDGLVPWLFLCGSLLYLVAPFSIIRYVVLRPVIDRETLLGALAAYLLIGMAFAFCYRFLGAVQEAFFLGTSGDGAVGDDLFFSSVTLTTTGYGNLVPAGNPGQSLAVLEALIGQLFLVTAVAKVVNAWKPLRRGVPSDD